MHPLFQCTCYGYPSKLMLALVRKSLSCSKEWYMSCGQPSVGRESSTHKTAIYPTWYVYFRSTKTSPRISWNFLNGHHPSAVSVRKSKRAILSHISSSGEKQKNPNFCKFPKVLTNPLHSQPAWPWASGGPATTNWSSEEGEALSAAAVGLQLLPGRRPREKPKVQS